MTANIVPKVFTIQVMGPPPHYGQLSMNPADLAQLYTDRNVNYYARIGERIYRIHLNIFLNSGCIGLQPHQYEDAYNSNTSFAQDGADCVTVQMIKDLAAPPEAKQIDLEVTPSSNYNKLLPMIVTIDKISALTKRYLNQNYFTLGQAFPIFVDDFILQAKVKNISGNLQNRMSTDKGPLFGLVGSTTTVQYNSTDTNRLIVLNSNVTNPYTTVFFTLLPAAPASDEVTRPRIIDKNKIKTLLVEKLTGKEVHLHKCGHIDNDNERLLFEIVNFGYSGLNWNPNSFSYTFEKEQSISIASNSKDIVLTILPPNYTKEIEISINSAKKISSNGFVTNDTPEYINAFNLKHMIKEIEEGFVLKQNIFFNILQTRLDISIENISGNKIKNDNIFSDAHPWKLSQNGKIRIYNETIVPLVDNSDEYELKDLSLNVSLADINDAFTTMPKNILMEHVAQMTEQLFITNKKVEINITGYPTLIIEPVDMTPVLKTEPTKYGFIGKITKTTKIKVKAASDNLKITVPFPQNLIDDPHKYLEEYGVGGISNECIDHLKKIVLSRTDAKDMMISAGIQLPKGMMLVGPPGTGKTNLARQLGEILGIPESNINIKNGPEVFNMWIGNSEANIREMFEQAKQEWERLGDKSSNYLLIIDEADAMLSRRESHIGEVATRVVDQFLGLVDGVKRIGNLFIIGITNRIDAIDPAVIRPGRLFPIIKVEMPTRDGRLSIFRIHTKPLSEKGFLDTNVDLKQLADDTKEMNGADIAHIIQDATMIWVLERSIQKKGY